MVSGVSRVWSGGGSREEGLGRVGRRYLLVFIFRMEILGWRVRICGWLLAGISGLVFGFLIGRRVIVSLWIG